MTLRAFILGLLAVVALCLFVPYASFIKDYGWVSQGAFPEGAVFVLVLLTVGLNVILKLVRRRWALRQSELMLVWCMLIVACTVPSEGLMSYWFPTISAPAYVARRADVAWRETSLKAAPEALMVSKDPRSEVLRQYFEGRPEGGRFPWVQWLRPVSRWLVFMFCFYMATFCLCGVLRKQWVERERLQFPLARVPLEFTEQAPGLLPRIFADRAFVLGVVVTMAFRFLRAVPLFFGAERAWGVRIPLGDVFRDTPLAQMYLENFSLWWMPIGFAYLVPADVSLSIWLFYLFGRVELQCTAWLGSTLHYGGRRSGMMQFQQAGSYLAFCVGALYVARRHLAAVFRKALGLRGAVDDAAEPVGYRLAFWGLVLSSLGCIGWFVHYGMKVWVAGALFALLMVIQFVHARIVAQSGVFVPRMWFEAPTILHTMGFGVFGPAGAVLAQMQWCSTMNNSVSLVSPAAIHSFRISEVFERRRRLLLPVLLLVLLVGIAAAGFMTLRQAYSGGALNFWYTWATTSLPQWRFEVAHRWIENPTEANLALWKPFGFGVVLTAFVMFMRARFYWWPIHPIGLLTIVSDHIEWIWMPFLLGWLTKVVLLKFSSGRLVRKARMFFVGLILVEASVRAVSALVSTFTDGVVPEF